MSIVWEGNDLDTCRACTRPVTLVADGCSGCLGQHLARLACWIADDGRMEPAAADVAALTTHQLAEYQAALHDIRRAAARLRRLGESLCPRAGEFDW
jgi:hypothetical protein